MDYFTALSELGLTEEELTRDRVRRTYLRRLREHPPEKDPDGFKRLRSAFELLREYAGDDEPPAPPETTPPVVMFSAPPPLVISVTVAPQPIAPPPIAPQQTTPPPPEPVLPQTTPVLPLPPLARPEPPEALSAVLPRILALLAGGEVSQALALEEKWREHGDDVRQGWMLDVARWALARELLGVALELPPPVLGALAKALQRDDLTLARPELSAFRERDAKAAGDANVLLFTRANSIFKQIERTLFVPTTIAPPFLDVNRILEEAKSRIPPRQRPRKQSAPAGFIYGGLVVVGLLLKLMVAGSSSYSPPSYRPIEIPKLYLPPPINPEMLFIPPPTPRLIYRDQSPPELTEQMVESSRVLQKYDIASEGQKQAAGMLEAAARKNDCRGMRVAFDELKAQPPHALELRKLYADLHVDALRQRLELICAKKKRGH